MKVRKWVKVLFLLFGIVLLLIGIFYLLNKKEENKENNENKETVVEKDISEIVFDKLKNENITYEFLSWVKENYNGSLEKLNELLTSNAYNLSLWHKATGYSFIVLNDLYNI